MRMISNASSTAGGLHVRVFESGDGIFDTLRSERKGAVRQLARTGHVLEFRYLL